MLLILRFADANKRRKYCFLIIPGGQVLFNAIIRRFFGDDDVVHVAFAQTGGRNAHESRLFLHLAHALARCPGRVETFVFATRLSYITRALRIAEPDRAIAAASRAAPDWDGGTRLGACLAEFNRAWSRRVLGAGARVILLSDGLERDGIELLEPEVARLARAAYQLVWINPLLRSEAYEPLAAGAQVLARHADQLRSAHNIASLAELAQLLN